MIREKHLSQPGVCGVTNRLPGLRRAGGFNGAFEPSEGYQGAKRRRGYYGVETTGGGVFTDLPRRR